MGIRTLAALAVLCCLVAGGCNGDPEPKIADPTPTPTSTAPSPSVTEATDPDNAYKDFIQTYVAAISESLSTGDPQPFLLMSDAACKNCQNLATGVVDAYANGGRIEGAGWAVADAVLDRTGELGPVWRVSVDRTAETWLDSTGQEVRSVEAGRLQFEFAFASTGTQLRVRELKPLAP